VPYATCEIIEGKTRLLVPKRSITEKVPPKVPAFFNPLAKKNRDLSILVYNAFSALRPSKTLTFADSLCGIGARGLRVAVELGMAGEVWMNDVNPVALRFARKAAKLNSIEGKCNFHLGEACSFLMSNKKNHKLRYDIVDLDPFGSPAQYADCVLRAVRDGGIISVTATDTAVLCGVYPKVCFRKYHGIPINNEYSNETGIRLLISSLAITAARLDLSISPLFTHSYLHFMRTYLKVEVTNTEANKLDTKLGIIGHCFKCGHRELLRPTNDSNSCSRCTFKLAIGGPFWKGAINNIDFLKYMIEVVPKLATFQESPNLQKSIISLLNTGVTEIQQPYYFLTDNICSKIKASPPPIVEIISALEDYGYKASRATLNSRGIKTDASLDEILRVLKKG